MPKQPNIIWIYCDELRADALGCYGHPELDIRTPNLDALAERGIRFSNNFCNSPICVPSRICTLTGRYCEQTGVYSNEGAWPHFRLPKRFDTFPQIFARNGYTTANFGKMHVTPEMQGSCPEHDAFTTHNPQGSDMGFWSELGEDAVSMIRSPLGGMNGGVWPEHLPYPPQAVTDNALAWLAQVKGPYLLRVSYLQPHTPVMPPARFAEMYLDQVPVDKRPRVPEGLSRYEKKIAELHGLHRMEPEAYRKTVAHYYGQVAWVDEQVGRIVEFLDKHNLLEETILVFGADHGNPLGETGGYEKHGFMQSVHRVPFLLSQPGTLPTGKTDGNICESVDLSRTLFDLTGVDAPSSFQGRSMVSDPPPDAVYATHSFGRPFSLMGPNGGSGQWIDGSGWPRRSCVRTQRWRFEKNMLINSKKPQTAEHIDAFLSDWQDDPIEETNLASDPAHAEIVENLSSLLDRHAEGSLDVQDSSLCHAQRGYMSREAYERHTAEQREHNEAC